MPVSGMRVNGWQRIWVVVAVAYGVTVALVAASAGQVRQTSTTNGSTMSYAPTVISFPVPLLLTFGAAIQT